MHPTTGLHHWSQISLSNCQIYIKTKEEFSTTKRIEFNKFTIFYNNYNHIKLIIDGQDLFISFHKNNFESIKLLIPKKNKILQ